MRLQEAIDKRKSIREYEKKAVPKEILKQCILNATKAPSSGNRQPWNFYCVNSERARDKIAAILRKTLDIFKKDIKSKSKPLQDTLNKFYSNMGDCPSIVFVYREKSKNEPGYMMPNDIASISCAIENLSLSAVERGLGTCWIGSFKDPKIERKVKKVIKAPRNQELIAAVLIGYPRRGYVPLKRDKKKLREVLKFI